MQKIKGTKAEMNILIYDVAAEYAGALTILKKFYNEVIDYENKTHNWYFVVSNNEFKEQENIKVISVPWIKKTWFHRWYYDNFCVKKLIKRYNIDLIFSMQNMAIKGVKCPQIVYLHQSLQFSPIKYSFFKKDERLLWIRQNIICNLMKQSLRYANTIVVQTKWMKAATKDWLKDPKKKIEVIPPDIVIKENCEHVDKRVPELFFYPAADEVYKNHEIIIRACEILQQKNIPYRVLFTMNTDESRYASKLYLEVKRKKLNIEFVGLLEYEQIMRLYKKATLVFPSCLESYGLPLLEAKKSDGLILCSDLPFAHEILDDYENAYFFNTMDEKQLADYMEKCSIGLIIPHKNVNTHTTKDIQENKSLVEYILEQERKC